MRGLLPLPAALLLGATAPVDRSVDYRLAPVMTGDAMTGLSVTLRFAADPSGTTRLSWPDEWAGETKLGQWARNIAVEGAERVASGPNGSRTIYAAPGASITVRYRIVSAFAGDPDVNDSREPSPVVRPGWFYAVGEALFARPEGQGDDDRPARFAWTGPRGIGFASDLEQGGGRSTLKDMIESIVIGGRDLHLAASGPAGHQVRVARIGTYAFGGPAFDDLVLKVIATERAFWRDRDGAPFLVTMTPVASLPGRISFQGTGRGDAFALWMDTSVPLDRVTSLLGHEYFHTWNPQRLGAAQPAPQERGYWFSEGLTDFYATRLMLRAGLISPEQFAATWNERLLRYAGSPFRTAANDVVAADFWRDAQAADMQYQRGAMLAAIWDRRLRLAGTVEGLDAVMRAQERRLATLPKRPTATALFARTAQRFGLDVRSDVAAHIDQGEPLSLPVDGFGRCARIVTEERPTFSRGWDVARTEAAGGVVSGLDPASPAYAAGLRDGMTLLKRLAGTPDDARADYVLQARDGGGERTIRFRPTGKGRLTVQELMLDTAAFAADPEACRRSLSG